MREEENALSARTRTDQALLLWGSVGPVVLPFLEPVFVVDAPVALPDSTGQHRIIGRGDKRFSVNFAMPEVADGDGRSPFAFVLPIRPGWKARASITLAGPSSVTLDGGSDTPMGIPRNPRTGQVRGILRDPPPATLAAADAVGQVSHPDRVVRDSLNGFPGALAGWAARQGGAGPFASQATGGDPGP